MLIRKPHFDISFSRKLFSYVSNAKTRLRLYTSTLIYRLKRLTGGQLNHLSRHLSISLMAFVFLSANYIVSPSDTNPDLAKFLPPDIATLSNIYTGTKDFMPTISEAHVSSSQVAQALIDLDNENYIEQLSILAMDDKNNPIAGAGVPYVVQKGDTYTSIAQKFNLDVGSIIAANGHTAEEIRKNPDILSLQVNQTINVPLEPVANPTDWITALNESKKAQAQAQELIKNKDKLKVAKNTKKGQKKGSANAGVATGARDMTTRLGFVGGQCTAGVAAIVPGIAAKIRANGGGNASRWYSVAKNAGMDVGQTPAAGGVIVTKESWAGHVAYVESVDGDNVTLVDMNYGAGNRGKYTRRTVNYRSIPTTGFIYGG